MSKKHLRQRAKEIAGEYGYLPYMIERYLSLWGEDDTLKFIEACERPIRTAIRVNTLKTTIDPLVSRLENKKVTLERIPWLKEGFWADFGGGSPGALFEHMLGYYYVQGVPSMTATSVLDPQEGEVVVDMAAAPGGKTTHIAQLMNNSGAVVAIDSDRRRIVSLESNIQRCGVANSIVIRSDSRKLSEMGITPDRIMLDAPCSGEGLIPLEPSRKTSRSMADVRFCATREDELLEAAALGLAPGGTMVYSTCSIAPEENEYVVDAVLQRHPEMRVVEIQPEFGSPGYIEPYGVSLNSSLSKARRFLPHLHGTEGFFICKLMKEGQST